MSIRSFVAVDLPDAVKEEVCALIFSLKRTDAAVRWVAKKNLHLTLKFLGYINDEQISGTKAFLSKISAGQNSFTFSLSGLGSFPLSGKPRVVWVGVDEGKEALENLAEKIEREAARTGFEKEERAFSAHLTVGRVREHARLPQQADLIQAIKSAAFSSAHKIKADHLTLYKSTLTGEGALYEPIEFFNFLSRETIK